MVKGAIVDTNNIARIQNVPLREVWAHEAHDFTTWLEANIDVLNQHLDADLDPENVTREATAGNFNVDLVCEDDQGRTVIVENQLSRTDHDHLGKLLTYAVAHDADASVWITPDPRPEHVKVVAWLNDSTPLEAWLFKAEAITIEDSPPALLLTRIVGPSLEATQVAATKQAKSARHAARRRFFTDLLDVANVHTDLHRAISPRHGPYMPASSGVHGIQFVYGVGKHDTKVIVRISHRDGKEENLRLFDALIAHRDEIDEAFGAALEWDRKEDKLTCTIRHVLEHGGWDDEDEWDHIVDRTVDAMIKLEGAFRPHIETL